MPRPSTRSLFNEPLTPKTRFKMPEELGSFEFHFGNSPKRALNSDELERIRAAGEKLDEYRQFVDIMPSAKKMSNRFEKLKSTAEKFAAAYEQVPMRFGYANEYIDTVLAKNRLDRTDVKKAAGILRKLSKIKEIAPAEAYQTQTLNSSGRDAFSIKLLQIFSRAGGVISKTKSSKGNHSNQSAEFLYSVGTIILTKNDWAELVIISTQASAEKWIAENFEKIKGQIKDQ